MPRPPRDPSGHGRNALFLLAFCLLAGLAPSHLACGDSSPADAPGLEAQEAVDGIGQDGRGSSDLPGDDSPSDAALGDAGPPGEIGAGDGSGRSEAQHPDGTGPCAACPGRCERTPSGERCVECLSDGHCKGKSGRYCVLKRCSECRAPQTVECDPPAAASACGKGVKVCTVAGSWCACSGYDACRTGEKCEQGRCLTNCPAKPCSLGEVTCSGKAGSFPGRFRVCRAGTLRGVRSWAARRVARRTSSACKAPASRGAAQGRRADWGRHVAHGGALSSAVCSMARGVRPGAWKRPALPAAFARRDGAPALRWLTTWRPW